MTNRTTCKARTTFNMIHNGCKAKNTVSIQAMRQDGTWGKPCEYERYGGESDEQVIERLIKLNNKAFRIAE